MTGLSQSSACLEMNPKVACLVLAALRLNLKLNQEPTLQLRDPKEVKEVPCGYTSR